MASAIYGMYMHNPDSLQAVLIQQPQWMPLKWSGFFYSLVGIEFPSSCLFSILLSLKPIKPCRPMTNNAGRLFHYRITVSPPTNFLVSNLQHDSSFLSLPQGNFSQLLVLFLQTDRPTVIEYDDHEYIFEGFSMFSHAPLTNVSTLSFIFQLY